MQTKKQMLFRERDLWYTIAQWTESREKYPCCGDVGKNHGLCDLISHEMIVVKNSHPQICGRMNARLDLFAPPDRRGLYWWPIPSKHRTLAALFLAAMAGAEARSRRRRR